MTTNSDTPKKKHFPVIPIALTLITLLLIFYVIWRVDTAPGTDDAYAYADTIDVVSEVSGKIINLPIRDNQAVKEGDLLFEIDPRPYQNALKAARAALVELNEEIKLAQRGVDAQKYAASAVKASVESARAAAKMTTETLQRMEPLLADGYVSAEAVDQARAAQRSAQAVLEAELLRTKEAASAVRSVDALVAQRAVMEVQIAIAELNVEFTKVYAPFDGRIASLDISEGQFASPLKPVCTLIDTRNWYVIANFREAELKNIFPGAHSTVYLMSNSDEKFQGTVDSIGYGVHPDDGGSTFGRLPRVKRSINWVRVAQRFPVKIMVDNPDPELFRIGASAVVTMHPARKPEDKE